MWSQYDSIQGSHRDMCIVHYTDYSIQMYGHLFLLLNVFYFIVTTGRKVEMILEFLRPPQATQQQQQEAGQSLLQLHSSYFYEGKVYNTGSVPFSRSVCSSVVDVCFGLPGSGSGSSSTRNGSGSGSFYYQAKIVRKTLIPIVSCLLYEFFYLKNYEQFLVAILKVSDENSGTATKRSITQRLCHLT